MADHAGGCRGRAHRQPPGDEDVSYRARSDPTQTDTARERLGFRPFAPKLPPPAPRSVELATSWNGPDMCQPGGAYICAAFLKKNIVPCPYDDTLAVAGIPAYRSIPIFYKPRVLYGI